ncbi:MAG: MFS transporter [Ancrocorticia sp.]|jgi:MHS family metabolite:H+ symporter-like MFS transporter|nr:MFS transporter [Ancrocorticia sp.]MCI2011984.1 MFS transporter [Ancrocorticia sp.]MCI2029699.1 MFS transporter [Ancrocorticia sp.]
MSHTSPEGDVASAEVKPTVVQRTVKDLVRAAVSGWLGTALEFMDFQLYSLAAALVFGEVFFANDSPGIAVVASMATYGVGYIARPLGAWYFGRLGDKIGRTHVLFVTIALMGIATTLIGALPTYQQVGFLAPLLLVVLRLVQGFGAGAEISGAGVMLAEYAPAKKRGLIASLVALGTNCGTLGASALWALLIGVLDDQQLLAWGWRIPFLGSFVIMLFAIWIRLRLKESPVFEERDDVVDGKALTKEETKARAEAEGDERMIEALHQPQKKAIAVAFLLRFGQAGNSGILQTYMASFVTVTLAMQKSVATEMVMISSLVAFITVPVIGWLGDKVGRKRMYTIMTSITLVLIIPTMMGIASGHPNKLLISYVILHNVSVMALAAMENLTLPEIFGARNRYSLTAVTREVAAIFATGLGPIIAAALVAAMSGSWIPVAIMVGFFTLCALGASIYMPEVAGRDLTDPRSAL